MTAPATIALVVALGCMLVDWWSVGTRRSSVEAVAKPAVMVALLAVAALGEIDPGSIRPWIVAGLTFGLAGDIVLLPMVDRFVTGLSAFLIGHLAYTVAFIILWSPSWWLTIGAAGVGALVVGIGRPIERSLRASALHVPVVAYVAVTGLVVVTGSGTARPLIVVGTLVFAASDALLGADRFLTPSRQHRAGVHVLYQLGQAAIVVGAIT